MLEAGETAVLLSTGAHLGEKPAFTGTLYFEMKGVEEFYGRVKDGVEMVWPLASMEYGTREFGVRDLDGYMWGLRCGSKGRVGWWLRRTDKADSSRKAAMAQRSSLRRPTRSQETNGRKKSACSARNDNRCEKS
jgi:hypothetical protein